MLLEILFAYLNYIPNLFLVSIYHDKEPLLNNINNLLLYIQLSVYQYTSI